MDEMEPQDAEPGAGESEIVEGEIVLAAARTLEPLPQPGPPMRRLAAVAATGFVAGAATAAVVGVRVARAQRARRAASPSGAPAEIVATRRLYVHVHAAARH